MRKIAISLLAYILVLSVNGNAAETVPIELASLDNSSSVGEIHNIEANSTSELKLVQSMRFAPEPIIMLILGFCLIVFATFWRKKPSHRRS